MRTVTPHVLPCLLMLLIPLEANGSNRQAGSAELMPAVVVSGHAYLEGQTDHSSIKVVFEAMPGSGHTDSTETDALGAYGWALNVGVYRVHFTKSAYRSENLPGEWFISSDTTLPDIVLEPGEVREIAGYQSGVLTPEYVYHVVGDVTVSAGDTLLIEPGVWIKFTGPYSIFVEGLFVAQGTQSDSVRFTSNRNPPAPGDWGSIYIRSGSANVLSYADLAFGTDLITVGRIGPQGRSGVMQITNSTLHASQQFCLNVCGRDPTTADIADSRISGAISASYGTLTVQRCAIVGSVMSSASVVFEGNDVTASSGDCFSAYAGSCLVRWNTFRGPGTSAIGAFDVFGEITENIILGPFAMGVCLLHPSAGVNVSNNTIHSCDTGVWLQQAESGHVRSNLIMDCSTGVEVSDTQPAPLVLYNSLHGNAVDFAGSVLPLGIGQVVTTNANDDSCDVYFNLYTDPLLTDPANGDFTLQAGSPCIDAGDPALALDPDGTVADIGAFYFHQGTPAGPAVTILADPVFGTVPLGVEFSSENIGGPVVAYAWDFGDGRGSTLSHPVHTYTEPDTFTVTMTAAGPGGQDTDTQTIIVLPAHWPPQCDFVAQPRSGYLPLAVCFTSTVVGEVNGYHWTFGDGGESFEANPCHVYPDTGSFAVCLTVEGPYGQDVECKPDYVVVHSSGEVVADFSFSADLGVAPLAVSFVNASLGEIDSYHWWFGDGTEDFSQNPVHVYTGPGTFYPSLAVTGPAGSDTLTSPTPIRVYPAEPTISAIEDVPEDQGGRVWVRWSPSGLDGAVKDGVVGYSVWQRDTQNQWFQAGGVLAQQEASYSFLAMTLGDSTAEGGIRWSVFRVTAHAVNPGEFYASEVDSGYSVDNLAPSIPQNLDGSFDGEAISIAWSGVPDHDFRYFEVHRSDVEVFEPSEQTRRGRTIDPSFADSEFEQNVAYFYRVRALDFAGNASPLSESSVRITTSASDPIGRPVTYGAVLASANPTAGPIALQVSLPEPAQVRIRIFDLSGALVRGLLLVSSLPAGRHPVVWDGRDDSGRLTSAGLYFFHLEAVGGSRARFTTSLKIVRLE